VTRPLNWLPPLSILLCRYPARASARRADARPQPYRASAAACVCPIGGVSAPGPEDSSRRVIASAVSEKPLLVARERLGHRRVRAPRACERRRDVPRAEPRARPASAREHPVPAPARVRPFSPAPRDHVDETHEREVAVDDGARPADHLDPVDELDRDLQRDAVDARALARERDAVDQDLHVPRVERELEAPDDDVRIPARVAHRLDPRHQLERLPRGLDPERLELLAAEDGHDAGHEVAVHARLRRDRRLLGQDREELRLLLVGLLRAQGRCARERRHGDPPPAAHASSPPARGATAERVPVLRSSCHPRRRPASFAS
jgi:hypothetical protein